MNQIQKKIQVNGHLLNYYLTYRTQKNIILRVREGQIYITAPDYAQDWEIEQLIYRNYAKINNIQNNYEVQSKYDFYASEPWIKIFDEPVKIVLTTDNSRAKMIDQMIQMHNYFNVEEQLTKIYPFLAQQYKNWFQNRVLQWAEKMEVSYKNLSLRILKMKWGVCYPQSQKIVLNIKLIHFDPQIIDYVIVHELAHLIYPNHSKNFWYLIAKILPNYQEIKKILDNSGI